MRNLFVILALIASVGMLGAEEAAAVVETVAESTGGGWQAIVATIIGTAITLFAVPYLRSKANAAKAEAEKHKYDASLSWNEQKNFIIDHRLIPFAYSYGLRLATERIPPALDGFAKGTLDWGDFFKGMLTDLKAEVIAKFQAEGLDIVKMMGNKAFDELVERKLLEALPIPEGMVEPAKFILDSKVQPFIMDRGVKFVTDQINKFGAVKEV